MTYPIEMQKSITRVEASRRERSGQGFPILDFAEKARLLEAYHPDYVLKEKKEIRIGPNKGDKAPKELVTFKSVYMMAN